MVIDGCLVPCVFICIFGTEICYCEMWFLRKVLLGKMDGERLYSERNKCG